MLCCEYSGKALQTFHSYSPFSRLCFPTFVDKSVSMKTLLALILFLFTASAFAQKPVRILQVPGAAEYCRIRPAGQSVLASGRYIQPAGQSVRITRAPFGLALSPDGRRALVLHHSGVVTVIDPLHPEQAVRVPGYDSIIKPLNTEPFLGAVFAADSKTAYLSGGDQGNVLVFNTETYEKVGEIDLNGPGSLPVLASEPTIYADSWTSDLAIDRPHNRLFVLDRGNNRLVKIDLTTRKILASVRVGRIPFGITLSPDGRSAFVANVGLYNYPLVPGVTPTNDDSMMLKFPPYAAHSREAQEGVTLPDGRFIPGLGEALAEEAMSVWVVDTETDRVTGKFKTGYQIGEKIEEVEIVGGASPNSVAVGSRYAYVSNASNDLISVIDYRKNKIVREIKLKLDKRIDQYRGMMPFGCSLSPDEKTLYVALLGLNAVAVVDVPKGKVRGYIPTGWGTTRVTVSADGRQLYILSARGYGAGPNGGQGFKKPPQGTYIGDIQLGLFQTVPVPDAAQLAAYTRQVKNNTFQETVVKDDGHNPCPPRGGLRTSPIRHVVYITKENRTYDEVFGQLPGGNGDATLARFGHNVTITQGKDTVRNANIAPNHLKIARQWAFSDNFYCDSDASIHGHHWMVGTMPNEYVEANSAASGRFLPFSKAPGRRFPRTAGGIDPEDYNEIGGLWENLQRQGISYWNFGENNEFAGNHEDWNDTIFGAVHPVPFPLPQSLWDHTSHNYAGYNTSIPDQFRMTQFEREFTQRWLTGRDTMPQFMSMLLPNDHTAEPRPADGYPYIHSYVADNDLALGRILHFLSRTPYWKSMLVIVTEDDPQGGVDHVDAHRSILMLAGPYVRRGYISHRHGNFGAALKLIYNVLGLPYVNQYDATATLLDDFFTEKAEMTPYDAELPDRRVFDPEVALNRYGQNFDWRKIQMGPKMDREEDMRRDHYRQQAKH